MIGLTYGFLTILEKAESKRSPNGELVSMVLCKCVCGDIKIYHLHSIKFGQSKSCGCKKAELYAISRRTHGLTHHPLFKIWQGIKYRCGDPNIKYYGAKGITVCKEWEKDFKAFYDWAIENNWVKGLDIDRIDNNKGYSPSNCRFITRAANCRNRSNNIIIQHNGQTKTLAEWADDCELTYGGLYIRYKKGIRGDELLSPTKKRVGTANTIRRNLNSY